jgi:hypothetical protein
VPLLLVYDCEKTKLINLNGFGKLAEITKTCAMTNFIVPIDFSVDSLKGLEWALLFSRKQAVQIQMVYVLA